MSNNNEIEGEAEAVEEEAEVEKRPPEEKLVCPNCGSPVRPIETPVGISYRCDNCKRFVTPKKIGEAPLEVLKPPEIELTEKVIQELSSKLRNVYGISREKAMAIIDTLKGNPNIALNPMNLYIHIKQLEPRANDYHLYLVISSIFQSLRASGWSGVIPPFAIFQQELVRAFPFLSYQPAFYGYPSYGYWYQPAPYGYPYPYPGYGYPGLYEHPRASSTPMKIVIDNQEITTDVAGYMAWKRFKMEEEQREREKQRWELEMKKLEAEIKAIEAGRSEGRREEMVEIEIEGTKCKVPASAAPAYLALKRPKEDEETRKLRDEISKLKDELHKREVEALQREIGDLRDEIKELRNQPSLWEQLDTLEKAAEKIGMKRGGRTTIDVIESGIDKISAGLKDLGERAERILTSGVGKEFRPEVKMGPAEREKKVEEIERKLEKGRELLEIEDKLVRAAAKLK
jgi:DNA-directed RNA polymerase subunit RPC12/RpoP